LVRFSSYASGQTERQRDRQTDILITILAPRGEIIETELTV